MTEIHISIKNITLLTLFLITSLTLISAILANDTLTSHKGYAVTLHFNASSHTNNTTSTSISTSKIPSRSLTQDTKLSTCAAYPTKFKITYPPSIWTESKSYQHCTIFTLTADKIFPNSAYIRICSAGSLPAPINSSIYEVAQNALFFRGPGVQLTFGPIYYGINVGTIAELYFKKVQSTLPFVNQSCTLPSAPVILAQGGALGNLLDNGSAVSSSSTHGHATLQPSAPESPSSNQPKSNTPISDNQTNITGSSTAAFYIMSFDHKKVYVIEYTAPEDEFERYLPVVRQMVTSFEFTGTSIK